MRLASYDVRRGVQTTSQSRGNAVRAAPRQGGGGEEGREERVCQDGSTGCKEEEVDQETEMSSNVQEQ